MSTCSLEITAWVVLPESAVYRSSVGWDPASSKSAFSESPLLESDEQPNAGNRPIAPTSAIRDTVLRLNIFVSPKDEGGSPRESPEGEPAPCAALFNPVGEASCDHTQAERFVRTFED